MKKYLIIILALIVILSLCACSFSFKTDDNFGVDVDLGDQSQGINLKGENIDITFTIPATMVDKELTQSDYDEIALEKGYKSVTLNNDGSVTYVMNGLQHEKMMEELDASFEKLLNETVANEDNKITKIEHNENYTDFKVSVDGESLGFADSLNSIAFMLYGATYNTFNCTPVENIHIEYISNVTGEVISETNSSDLAN